MNIIRRHIRTLSAIKDLKNNVDNVREQARKELRNLQNGLRSGKKNEHPSEQKSISQYAAQFPKAPKGSPDDLQYAAQFPKAPQRSPERHQTPTKSISQYAAQFPKAPQRSPERHQTPTKSISQYAAQFPKAPKGSPDHHQTPSQRSIQTNKASKQDNTRSSVRTARRLEKLAERMQQRIKASTHRQEKIIKKTQDALKNVKNIMDRLSKEHQNSKTHLPHKAKNTTKSDTTKQYTNNTSNTNNASKQDFQFIKKYYPSAVQNQSAQTNPKSTASKTAILLNFYHSLKNAPLEDLQTIYKNFTTKEEQGKKSDYDKLNTHRGYGTGLTKSAQAVERIFKDIVEQKKLTSNITMTPLKDAQTLSSTFKSRYQHVTAHKPSEKIAPKEESSFNNNPKGP
jgi:hypothetical protein